MNTNDTAQPDSLAAEGINVLEGYGTHFMYEVTCPDWTLGSAPQPDLATAVAACRRALAVIEQQGMKGSATIWLAD